MRLAFSGSRASLHSDCSSPDCRLAVIVDGGSPSIVRLPHGSGEIALVEGLAAGAHQLELRTCPDKSVSSDAYDCYGMLLGRALDAQCHLISFGGRGLIRDYQGIS